MRVESWLFCLCLAALSAADVPCPGGGVHCPDGNTCCELPGGSWGCCPLPNAVCCSDHMHCCPHDDTCDVRHGTCIGRASGSKTPLRKKKQSYKLDHCDDQTCEHGQCCRRGCCPFKTGACCDDGKHCCPEGTSCDNQKESCVFSSKSSGHFALNWTSVTKKSPADNWILCLDGASKCPANSSCCSAGDSYSCCPANHGVCCEGSCCPKGYECDEGAKCKKTAFKDV